LDCGSEFVASFMQSLGQLLGMELHFTLAYHPEADSQTKCTNQTIKAYLQIVELKEVPEHRTREVRLSNKKR
jgi:dihydroxyacid dehydratase/phosphogluconate dehydratase